MMRGGRMQYGRRLEAGCREAAALTAPAAAMAVAGEAANSANSTIEWHVTSLGALRVTVVSLLLLLFAASQPECAAAAEAKIVRRDAPFKLTVLHTNDVHARYEQANKFGGTCEKVDAAANRCYGGAARRYTKIQEIRRQNAESAVLLLDAGDQYQGTFWFYVHRDNITSHFMRKLGYDAMALGNHEFDIGVAGLAPFVAEVSKQFPVLSCNMNASGEPSLSAVGRYAVLQRGGRRIGIIGYSSPQTPFLTNVGATGNAFFYDDVSSIREAAAQLKQEGVDIIIALGHSGYDVDQRIAKEVEEVDVVVGGHSHTFLFSGIPPSNDVPEGPYPTVVTKRSGTTALVVQDFFFGKYLGQIDVYFDSEGKISSWSGAPILLDGSIPEDSSILADVRRYGEEVTAKGAEVFGSTNVFLQGGRDCRLSECNLGNAIADSFVFSGVAGSGSSVPTPSSAWARASLAVINGGNVRQPVAKGLIRYSDVFGVLPFRNQIDAVTLAGREVLAMFEQSAAQHNPQAPAGGFLQVSGFKVVFHMYKPPYMRVASVQTRCLHCDVPTYEPLDVNQNYTILMPTFMVQGGDNYTVIRDKHLKRDPIGEIDSDMFIKYIEKYSPLVSGLEQRLQLLFTEEQSTKKCKQPPFVFRLRCLLGHCGLHNFKAAST